MEEFGAFLLGLDCISSGENPCETTVCGCVGLMMPSASDPTDKVPTFPAFARDNDPNQEEREVDDAFAAAEMVAGGMIGKGTDVVCAVDSGSGGCPTQSNADSQGRVR